MSRTSAQKHIKNALKLIEQTRYKIGTADFFTVFIDNWAFEQTGLYPPTTAMPADVKPLAIELSHELSAAMAKAPAEDILAVILSELGAHKRGGSYFPTPPHIAQLMSKLIGVDAQEENAGGTGNTFYEPCCGTGALTLKWLEDKFHQVGVEGMKDLEVHLEDLDSLMVKCSFIQVLHFLSNKGVTLKALRVQRVNVLTREEYPIVYYATAA